MQLLNGKSHNLYLLSLLLLPLVSGVIQRNGCTSQVDIVVLVDQSNLISSQDYEQIKKFIADVSHSFGISYQMAHISLILAYHDTDVILHLDEIVNSNTVVRLAQQLPHFRDPYIRLGKALRMTRQEINGPRSRLLAKKVVIILTNGNSQDGFLDEAMSLRKETDMVYTIGFGEFMDSFALSVLASASENVFVVKPGKEAGGKLEKISHNVMDIACRNCYLDVCFLIDVASVSNEQNLNKMKHIMEAYIKVFLAGNNVRFAVVEASSAPRVLLRLDNVPSAPSLRNLMQQMDFVDFSTTQPALGAALSVAKDDIFHVSQPPTKKALVIFSDGMSTDSPEHIALKLKSDDVYVHVYSFGKDRFMPFLVAMATDRDQNNIMYDADAEAAEEKGLTMRTMLCGGCQDKSIFCVTMSLWGLCKNIKTKEKCPASCQICYKSEPSNWIRKWKQAMKLSGPLSNRPFKMSHR